MEIEVSGKYVLNGLLKDIILILFELIDILLILV